VLNKNANNARKTLALGLIATGVLVTLTGCGATGVQSPTRNIRQVTDGVEGDSGDIKARDVLLVAQPDGSAVLIGTIVNDGANADSLTSISVNGITATITPAQNNLVENKPIIFSGDAANAHAAFAGLNAAPSSRVNMTISFANSASMQLNVMVRAKSDIYANVG
jgi:hypothetical protein